MDNKTLVERLEGLSRTLENGHRPANAAMVVREAAAALRATGEPATVDLGEHGLLRNATVKGVTVTVARPDQVQGCCFMGEGIPRATVQYSVAADSVIGPFPADPANMGIKAEALRATGEGEWIPQVVARLREVESALRNTDEHYALGKACGRMADGLAAAPTPAEPLRDAPTNPGEISSKVVGPLRDAGAVDGPPALIALWRQREPDNGEEFTEFDKGYEQASEECANSLERWWLAHPAPQQPTITDAMVERLADHLRKQMIYRCMKPADIRANAREYLTAAQEGKS